MLTIDDLRSFARSGPALTLPTQQPCSLCRVVERLRCPRCSGIKQAPVVVSSVLCSVDEFVSAVRQAEAVSLYILVHRGLRESLIADKVADRMLARAGVLRIGCIADYNNALHRHYVDALTHVNRSRVSVQRPLDPVAAGWTEDDVFVEAYRLGWIP